MGVLFSQWNDGTLVDYPCCDDFLFRGTYPTYCKDLTGGSRYFKPVITKGKPTMTEVSSEEVRKDLTYLSAKAKEWEQVIIKQNHKYELLQQAATEGRYALKQVDNLPEIKGRPYIKGTHFYDYKKMGAMLQSRYMFLMAEEVMRDTPVSSLSAILNSVMIEINEYSLIHVLNRHFAQIIKTYDRDKTFHGEDIKYRKLPGQLKDILAIINDSKALVGKQIGKIAFQYRAIPYMIYTGPAYRSPKGQKTAFTRLHTFFPIGSKKILDTLKVKCDLVVVNDEYSVYVPR
jgi:hypothetical protein